MWKYLYKNLLQKIFWIKILNFSYIVLFFYISFSLYLIYIHVISLFMYVAVSRLHFSF